MVLLYFALRCIFLCTFLHIIVWLYMYEWVGAGASGWWEICTYSCEKEKPIVIPSRCNGLMCAGVYMCAAAFCIRLLYWYAAQTRYIWRETKGCCDDDGARSSTFACIYSTNIFALRKDFVLCASIEISRKYLCRMCIFRTLLLPSINFYYSTFIEIPNVHREHYNLYSIYF